jgi:hypothetical protein
MTQSEQRRVLADYVAGLRSLCAEVSAATLALSRNDLSDFEARLEAQQSISQQLKGVKLPPEAPASEENVACTPEQTEISALRAELRRAQQELAHNTRIFSSLVKRSALTVSWLSLLCQSYNEGYGKISSTQPSSRVSCEV